MAGVCVGPGLFGGPDGIELYGPRSQAWNATGPGCAVDAVNGLRIDPVTQKLWAPPDSTILNVCAAQPVRLITPSHTGSYPLTKLSIKFTAFACRRTFWMGTLTAGTAHFRMAAGNFWSVKCSSTIKINGVVPIYGFGQPYVNTAENSLSAAGAITMGAATANITEIYYLNPADVLTLDVVFTMEVFTYTANLVNVLNWTPPQLTTIGWSYPL